MGRPCSALLLCVLIPGVFGLSRLGALDFTRDRVRLTLHEATGRFSLYCRSNPDEDFWEPFFTGQDPRSSFLAVNVNGRVYRMGEASGFRIMAEEGGEGFDAALVFQSSFLIVRQEFLFIKTSNSELFNGVKMTVQAENIGPLQSSVGLRMLIDTHLGEESGKVPFITDRQKIHAETIIPGSAEDKWWISRNERLSLMGSIALPGAPPQSGGRKPDMLHFANWKRLNDAPWKTAYSQGRNFNLPPYSIGDSAVCYYYEPAPLERRESLSCAVFLGAEDPGGFDPPPPSLSGQRDADLALLRSLITRLDKYIVGEVSISEEELAAMEQTISQLKARYGLP